MSDNVQLNAGAGGDVIGADDVAGVKYQIVKLAFGVDGAITLVSASDGLPITGTITANAGTNLNTSALALETGGNLASAVTALQIMDDWDNAASDGASVSGDVAHDAGDVGEPVKLGARAVASIKAQAPVAANDRTDAFADVDGILLVKSNATFADLISERVVTSVTAALALSTFNATASHRNYITAVTVYNSHATTNGALDLLDGTAGSVIWTFPAPAGGGTVLAFNPPLKQPTMNTALGYKASATIADIVVSVNGFQSKA